MTGIAHVTVDARRVRPIAFDGNEVEALAFDEFARNACAHPIELRSAVGCLPKEHDPGVPDAIEQGRQVRGFDGFEPFASAGDGTCQQRVSRPSLRLPVLTRAKSFAITPTMPVKTVL